MIMPGTGAGLLLTRPMTETGFAPVRVAELELSEATLTLRARTTPEGTDADAVTTGSLVIGNHARRRAGEPRSLYGAAHVLVRLHGEPLGVLTTGLDAGDLAPADLLTAVRRELGDRIDAHLAADGLPPAPVVLPVEGLGLPAGTPRCRAEFAPDADSPFVSVVVPTCGRPDQVMRCLDALLHSEYPSFEILVVDNKPSQPATRVAVTAAHAGDPRVRYLTEPRPGASHARNTGIAAATGEIVAFTDDDVVVDAGWLAGIVGAFARDPEVGCVAGLTHPLALETPGQVWFECYAGFSRGHDRRTLRLHEKTPPTVLYPYTAGVFGASNNLAVRASTLRAIGGFDTRLGPATAPSGGEDIDLCLRIVLAGGGIAHEPRALVRHEHRRDLDAVRRQLYTYGTGTTAVLMKYWLTDRRLRRLVVRRLISAIAALSPEPTGSVPSEWQTIERPSALGRASMRGQLAGPLLWLRENRRRAQPHATGTSAV